MGLQGVVRGRAFKKATISDPTAAHPSDLVKRKFTATRPNQLWLSDLTYVATWRGFVYVAFVIDAFARWIVGWRARPCSGRIYFKDPSRHISMDWLTDDYRVPRDERGVHARQ